jgi:hypothetical protein
MFHPQGREISISVNHHGIVFSNISQGGVAVGKLHQAGQAE